MMIQDMGRYLQERGIGAVGKYIFLSLLPDSPVECMALYEYQGQPGNQIAGTEAPGLQICVRTKRYPDGYVKLKDAHNALKAIGFEDGEIPEGVVINDVQYFRAQPAMSGIIQDRDENGNLLLKRSYYITKEEE